MSENIQKKAADAVVGKDVVISFDVRARSRWEAWWHWLNPKARTASYTLKPITLGSLIKISKLLVDIDLEGFDKVNFMESSFKAIAEHGAAVGEIVAIALHGKPGDVPESLRQAVHDNFSAAELQETLMAVLMQMNVSAFMISIISMKRLNVQEMSQDQEELIAPGVSSEV